MPHEAYDHDNDELSVEQRLEQCAIHLKQSLSGSVDKYYLDPNGHIFAIYGDFNPVAERVIRDAAINYDLDVVFKGDSAQIEPRVN